MVECRIYYCGRNVESRVSSLNGSKLREREISAHVETAFFFFLFSLSPPTKIHAAPQSGVGANKALCGEQLFTLQWSFLQ